MNRQDYLRLQAEQKFLDERLVSLPENAWITRQSTESRLRAVEEQLKGIQISEREPARIHLTFNGRPVVGSHGIFAEFGMKAVNSFTEAIIAVAASLAAPLKAMGPIPNKDQNQLLITNTALGSFGFELEEYHMGQLSLDEQTAVEQAVERTRNLLQGAINPDDELLADSAAELDQRALDKVRAFVNTLAENEAICALQFRDRIFHFTDVGQVRTSLARISQDNLREEEQCLEGEFQGVLPKRRTFEFRLADRPDVITGKVGPAVLNPEELNAHLYQFARIKVMMTRVGNGCPRYLLLEPPEWGQPLEAHPNGC